MSFMIIYRVFFRLSDKLSPEQVDNAEKIFSSYIKEGCRELTFEDFKKVIPCKNVSHKT